MYLVITEDSTQNLASPEKAAVAAGFQQWERMSGINWIKSLELGDAIEFKDKGTIVVHTKAVATVISL